MAGGRNPVVPVELKFLGNVNDKPLFLLNFAGNAEENEFTIIITDENGNRYYREVVKGENFSKRFLLDVEDFGNGGLKFEVYSKKSSKPAVFKINRETHLVEEIAVNKL